MAENLVEFIEKKADEYKNKLFLYDFATYREVTFNKLNF